jgi:anti-sigma factor RsiW
MDITPENSPLTEVQDLIWALLDQQISESDFKQLEAMLEEDEEARRLYVQCVQIHVDLQQWYGGNSATAPRIPAGAPLDLPLLDGGSPVGGPAF